ncbi:hypothetical protein [Frankia sp. R82]|nr:hypothetical protein [Frankia sp. R82]
MAGEDAASLLRGPATGFEHGSDVDDRLLAFLDSTQDDAARR